MKALFKLPHPLLSLLLLIIWLLLVNSVAPGQIFLGAVLALAVPRLTGDFWPDRPRCVRVRPIFGYSLMVIWDIVIANAQVAMLILGPARRLKPAFVHYPLALQEEFAITVLASTISLTPGTVTADVSADRKALLIHALNVEDEQALIAHIRQRYEQPLKEIFEC
ncbi:MAG: Na+/H+ antiporter subunit E [Pseudomonadota bacterium]